MRANLSHGASIWSSEIVSKGRFYEILPDFSNESASTTSEKWENWPGYTAYTQDDPGQSSQAMVKVKTFLASVRAEAHAQKVEQAAGCTDAEEIGRFVAQKLSQEDRHLLEVARKMSPKGTSGLHQVQWYKNQFQTSSFIAGVRAARDFFSSFYFFQFTDVPSLTYKLLDASGSLIGVTMAVDFFEASDEEKWGGLDIFATSSIDGFDYLLDTVQQSGHIRTVYDDLVKVSSYISLRKTFEAPASSNAHGDAGKRSAVTPGRFLELRWWDAAMVPYHRVVQGFANADLPCDADGTPHCALLCPRIRRAMDSLIRYNEIVDVISDAGSDERFNEVLIAFALGGVGAVKNYARALAAVIEDVITCSTETNCPAGLAGHQWAADLALGANLAYALAPRYQMLRQISDAAQWQRQKSSSNAPKRGHLLPGVTSVFDLCKLDKIAELHQVNWEPAWCFVPNNSEYTRNTDTEADTGALKKCPPCSKAANFICQRILRRVPESDEKGSLLTKLIYDVIVDPEWHPEMGSTKDMVSDHCVPYDPIQYPRIWHRLCTLLYNYRCETPSSLAEIKAAANILEEMVRHFCHAIWTPTVETSINGFEINPHVQAKIGYQNEGISHQDDLIPIMVHLYTSVDKLVRNTHLTAGCYGDGAWRRHVIIGLCATFLEFSPVVAYDRIINYAFDI